MAIKTLKTFDLNEYPTDPDEFAAHIRRHAAGLAFVTGLSEMTDEQAEAYLRLRRVRRLYESALRKYKAGTMRLRIVLMISNKLVEAERAID